MNLYGEIISSKLEAKGFKSLSELSNYVKKFLINRQNIIYLIDDKYYMIPGVDLNLGKVRLLETNHEGNYLFDGRGKTIKRQISIEDFEDSAVVSDTLEIKYT